MTSRYKTLPGKSRFLYTGVKNILDAEPGVLTYPVDTVHLHYAERKYRGHLFPSKTASPL
ncbi:unnamed protein product, partial [Allacma fusca]